jgi:hypothetical protein
MRRMAVFFTHLATLTMRIKGRTMDGYGCVDNCEDGNTEYVEVPSEHEAEGKDHGQGLVDDGWQYFLPTWQH